jgi:hypothetical protein
MAVSLGVNCETFSSKDLNTGTEEATALEAVTRRQPVKTQQTEQA